MFGTLTRIIGTLTRIIGTRTVLVFEDQELTGKNYGILLPRKDIPWLRVSPSVYKLMRDDFESVANVLRVKTIDQNSEGGGDCDAKGILSELSVANHRSKALPQMRRVFRNRVHRKHPTKASAKSDTSHRTRDVPPPPHVS